jgi:hypothetical protein
MKKTPEKYKIEGIEIKRGARIRINIDMGSIYDFTDVKMPIEVIRGEKDGPTLFVSSTIHGDEINGIEIIRELTISGYFNKENLKNLSGMLILIPIVNIFGFNDRTRYLPDRRDLNRCFPGAKNGSLTSQLAHKFIQEIVSKSDYGIDLHTGAFHRFNYPQIRADISDKKTFEIAKIFNSEVIINSNLRDGSLRAAGSKLKIPMILFEAGEALRFDDDSIKIGLNGILNVMTKIGMINKRKIIANNQKTFIANSSFWVRAPSSGVHIMIKKIGEKVKKNEILSEISNPFGDKKILVKAKDEGMIIGISKLPLVNKGDALFHIASEKKLQKKISKEAIQDHYEILDPINSV